MACTSTKREREEEKEENEILKQQKLSAKTLQLRKIISGGQTGADYAALKVARKLGLSTGGWTPPKFMTEAGKNPKLGKKYSLQELSCRSTTPLYVSYIQRSKKNVDDSDATLVFRIRASPGTDKTIGYCLTGKWQTASSSEKHYRPVLVITDAVLLVNFENEEVKRRDADAVRAFLIEHNVKTLNVAGHRQDSKDPTWQSRVLSFLLFTFQ
jgi:hypothetical protein